ncbi:DUF4835 domain-containing protein [Mucilaginibacter hurinus]|uniref:DUF4835 domain-containing protein n=1 Tax=Mucilaginibacter hurinus TaxID=2201324 RepID=A0A367GPK8_9SPHI|nr:DUF4835 family protein [Mucilaginibacter hurinus]RCH55407.1 DUF4835 domain-containing protein [Mucilaginibacter hurinus]
MKKLCLYILFICFSCSAAAQDLNARVQVLSPRIQVTNKRIFDVLETAMRDFLNGRKWSPDEILPGERIDCTFVLTITAWDNSSNFSGELQVQASRPVYNSAYTTTLLNINDRDFDFTYTEGQTIDYTDQNFQGNLSAVMAFYAYMILGMDYDSYSRYGGSPFFAAAQNIVINAQTGSFRGWKAFDGNVNRYWMAENMNNKIYANLRSFMYDYHRNGLDVMSDNVVKGRTAINKILPTLAEVDRKRLGSMFPLVFFTTKSNELVSIFSKASPPERSAAYNILTQIDPANGMKYKELQGN